eukprot:1804421-Rhodomonas_salina.1
MGMGSGSVVGSGAPRDTPPPGSNVTGDTPLNVTSDTPLNVTGDTPLPGSGFVPGDTPQPSFEIPRLVSEYAPLSAQDLMALVVRKPDDVWGEEVRSAPCHASLFEIVFACAATVSAEARAVRCPALRKRMVTPSAMRCPVLT